ncbi:hypothetical protein GALMADRAFT_136362 [Galerina marginata CBS 339.88]|uniref:Uncharacterized protein n=1 Tax=Galerina marginata (strain CBS 339.88) TaxID=685588 RepID=A0A067T9C3_GALM3|nr:hypothetical protein GALMADRAFT_136362 [Galerina marginata CBS 339.88]
MFVNLAWKAFQYFALFFGAADETYYKYTKFSGIRGPVNCLSFSPGGELLASGGDDEIVRIWEITTKKCLHILEDPGKRWGQITCLAWLSNLGTDDLKPIAFGTGRGLIVIYRRSRVDAGMVELASNRVFEASDPVESMAFNAKKSYLAITSHHGRIALFDIARNGTMMELWSVKADSDKKVCIPRSIQFYEGGKKVLIFILETGEMVCCDVETAREDWQKLLKSGIGYASLDSSGKLLLVDNLSRGFDLYNLPRSSPSYTFAVPTKKKCVKDGAFAEQASAIVCSSDHGKVYVFSMASSSPIQVLKSASKHVEVQAIDTTSTPESHFIASGSSAAMPEIVIWEKQIKKTSSRVDNESNIGRVINLLNLLVILLLLHWTSRYWVPIASQAVNRAMEIMNNVQVPVAEVSTNKPHFTEWTVEIPIQVADEEDEEDEIEWRELQLDRL